MIEVKNVNGGVFVHMERFDGAKVIEFLERREAVDLALKLLHGVANVPHELDAAIRGLK